MTSTENKESDSSISQIVNPRSNVIFRYTHDNLAMRVRCDVSELKKILAVASEYNDTVNFCFSHDELYIQSPYIKVVCLAIFRLKAPLFREYYLDERLQSLVVGVNVKEMYDTTKKGTSNCHVVLYMRSPNDTVLHIEFHNTNDCGFTEGEYPIQTVDQELVDIPARDFDLSMPIPTSKFKDAVDQLSTTGARKVYLQLDWRGLVLYVENGLKVHKLYKYLPWISGTLTGEGARKKNFRYVGYFMQQILSSFAKLSQGIAEGASFQVHAPANADSPLFIQFQINLGTITFVSAQSMVDPDEEVDDNSMIPVRVLNVLNEIPARALRNDIEVSRYRKYHEQVLAWDGETAWDPLDEEEVLPPGPVDEEEEEPVEFNVDDGTILPPCPGPLEMEKNRKRAQDKIEEDMVKKRRTEDIRPEIIEEETLDQFDELLEEGE